MDWIGKSGLFERFFVFFGIPHKMNKTDFFFENGFFCCFLFLDPFVEMDWGARSFRTTTASNSKEPSWNATTHIFVDQAEEKDFRLKFMVRKINIFYIFIVVCVV